MYIMVLGLRSFPGVQGGVETHAEHLYPLLVKLGSKVEVIARSPYMPKTNSSMYCGVRLLRLWSPRKNGFEAFIHSLLGVLYAAVKRPDILHIHAIGPAIMTPLARMLGLRVVVTHHGQDYDREKWGVFARWVLRTGERLGMRYSHQRIVISKVIADLVRSKYQCESVLIPNGVSLPVMPHTRSILDKFDLDAGRYILQVSRLVPEKKQLDLVRAFAMTDLPGWKLVLVAALEPQDEYVRSVLSMAQTTPNVILTGFQCGLPLQELFAHAGAFVLPSSHEGLPIALLEALSYGLPVIASNIPANLEVGLPDNSYFPLGDVFALKNKLLALPKTKVDDKVREQIRNNIKERYNWESIAKRTLNVYEGVCRPSS